MLRTLRQRLRFHDRIEHGISAVRWQSISVDHQIQVEARAQVRSKREHESI